MEDIEESDVDEEIDTNIEDMETNNEKWETAKEHDKSSKKPRAIEHELERVEVNV